MSADVISPPGFRPNPDVPQEEPLEPSYAAFEDLPITEPQYGEETIGTLTDEEAAAFVAYYNANAEAMSLDREVGGSAFESLGQSYRSGALQSDKGFDFAKSLAPEVMREFFRAMALTNHLKASFFWGLGERLGCHDYTIGIRTKRRICRLGRKWG